MSSEAIYDIIKKTIRSYLPDSRILLFGSRAKGNNDAHSDYDLLVITAGTLTQKERLSWSSQIDRAIVKAIHAPIDLLLFTEDEIQEKQQLPGHIVRSAMKDGVAL